MRRKERIIIYICNSIKNNKLVSKQIEARTLEDATTIFEKEYQAKAETVFGPFYRKKTGNLKINSEIKFNPIGENIQGVYDNWNITAMKLINPKDCVYVMFNNRIDDKKIPKPKPTILKLAEIKQNEKNTSK